MPMTTHHQGPKSFKKDQLDINPEPAKPGFTVLLMLLPLLVTGSRDMFIFGPLLKPNLPVLFSNGNIDWVTQVGFTAAKFGALLASGFQSTIPFMCTATLAQLTPVNWVLNSLFIWMICAPVERRMKGWRFPTLAFATIATGWVCVFINAGFNQDKLYIGPSMMLFGMLGAFFAFFPKKAFKPEQWIRPSTEIFKKEDKTPINERYYVSPWAYVIAFVVYQIFLQFMLSVSKDQLVNMTGMSFLGQVHTIFVGRMQVNPAAFNPIAAMLQIGAGALIATVLPSIGLTLKPRRPGGSLQLEVIQHYRELRALDMTHAQASEGAAKFAAVPIEIAKDWINKGAAGLKDQNIKQQ